ncbi:MAG TPA: VOC family protein [Fimbriimonadaceae bacterium]|nr:VOC family protein [Fimbriimonadaceae bacterium]
MSVLGIHHVTAISADIVGNLAFYTGVLGMRLVKKSVNQDDVSAYHLFYADALGSPGTDLTFFDWPRVTANRPGPGTISLTLLRAPRGTFDYWESRLTEAGVTVDREPDRLSFQDPEGQRLALIADDEMPGEIAPWDAVVPSDLNIRGILGVEIESSNARATEAVLRQLLGFEEVGEGLWEVRTSTSLGQVRVLEGRGAHGRPGRGGVHHVAFRARDDQHLTEIENRVEAAGIRTSGYVDRHYFHSLYFREPGGVLFEVATDGPGMHIDEDPGRLGERLSVPPFLEHRREFIEGILRPLPPPAYASTTSAE